MLNDKMREILQLKKPEFEMGKPVWWHHHGSKMRVRKLDLKNRVIILLGSAASVKIRRKATVRHLSWVVDWEVVNSSEEKVNGRVYFETRDLESAFGISGWSGEYGRWLIERYGADVAQQRCYIRYENFLNIPCPGTGHDGDPNVSIELRDEIKEAVKKLLGYE